MRSLRAQGLLSPALQTLPPEILSLIGNYIDAATILQLRLAMRQFYATFASIFTACATVKSVLKIPNAKTWPVFEFKAFPKNANQAKLVAKFIHLLDKHNGSTRIRITYSGSIRLLKKHGLLTRRIHLELSDSEKRSPSHEILSFLPQETFLTKLRLYVGPSFIFENNVARVLAKLSISDLEIRDCGPLVVEALRKIKGLKKVVIHQICNVNVHLRLLTEALIKCVSLQEVQIENLTIQPMNFAYAMMTGSKIRRISFVYVNNAAALRSCEPTGNCFDLRDENCKLVIMKNTGIWYRLEDKQFQLKESPQQ
ncbi:hypothetical protein HK100_010164 [Physocladia obscura]|uniref:F-box domain-containing protein n=1 Tax=Physocladia obscura TaxID=109957 RepID=A0AAD5T928_9FUNG|nr:hypothetical protein HK100_010164 [Physocladia obscura]